MKRLFVKQVYRIIFFINLFIMIFNGISFSQQSDSLRYPPKSFEKIPSINFKDTDIRDILRSIAFEYKTNIWVDNNITARTSIALYDVTVLEALEIITKDNGLKFDFDPVRFLIGIPEKKESPPPIEPDPKVYFNSSGNRISIELAGVNIKNFVDELRKETGKNFLLTPGTGGKLTGVLKDIELNTGLRNILQNNGFYLTITDSIYYISRSAYFSTRESNESVTSNYWVSASDNLVTIDVKNADLNQILEDITYQLNLPVVKLADPKIEVTVKCANLPLDRALYYLFRNTEYTFKNEDGTYVVGDISTKNMDEIKLIKLQHLRADNLKEKMPSNLEQNLQINVSLEHNALIVRGRIENIMMLEEFVRKVDSPVPQVMIEALVVDYNLDNLFEFGMSAGRGDSVAASRPDKWFPGFDVTASGNKINKIFKDIGDVNIFGQEINVGNLGQLPEDFFVNIRMLEENGVANIKSRPILSTLNGHKASLKIGTIQNYVFKDILPVTNQLSSTFIEKETIQEIEAMGSFEITPWVGPNNQLTIELKPDFQTPVGEFSPDKNEIPAINTRTLESTVRLKDGETIVVGGLIQDIETTTVTKMPFIGDIPYLGELFKNKRKQKTKAELIIYLTPHIFYEDNAGLAYYNFADGIDR
ncbi:MAG: hypothetical protein K9H48_12255 [Melioribacteraceae bacterium]|nr:hypothetical protein [Melioribacteraceae bacterium]